MARKSKDWSIERQYWESTLRQLQDENQRVTRDSHKTENKLSTSDQT